MRPAVRNELLRINRAFYQSLAVSFAETRRRPQPGVRQILAEVDRKANVLDVGCGHGLAAEELAQLGYEGRYCGMDSSEALIGLARQRVRAAWANFDVADVTGSDWDRTFPHLSYDWVLAFAILHHIPDGALRVQVVTKLQSTLSPDAHMAVSVWDFESSDRWRRRVVPWTEVGLTAADVEPGDALLDWRHGERGLRYVHRFSSVELTQLAREAGLTVVEEFRSDGQGGQLGLYQVWVLQGSSVA